MGLAGGEGEAGQLGALVAQLQQMGTQDAASRDQALARLTVDERLTLVTKRAAATSTSTSRS